MLEKVAYFTSNVYIFMIALVSGLLFFVFPLFICITCVSAEIVIPNHEAINADIKNPLNIVKVKKM